MLRFINDSRPETAAKYIGGQIRKRLDNGRRVAWFLSGGSAIKVASLAVNSLKPSRYLAATLVDERYGSPGHPDSNWEQLAAAGFGLKNARLEPVLKGGNPDQTLADYEHLVNDLMGPDNYKIALLGIGEDGHTAGILPHSPAIKSNTLASFYETPEFRRITLTPRALAGLDEAVVFAVGENKHEALQNLSKDLSLEMQPAQILKKIPLVTIYNDLLGDRLE